MSLKSQIEEAAQKALVEHNERELGVFRMLKSAIKNKEIDLGHDLSDEEVVAVLENQAKQRRDSIDQFEKAGRNELAATEKAELEIISKYLPEKMSEEDIRPIVKQKVAELAGQDFGRIMGAVMGELKGKADGATVQKVVKEELGQ